MKLTLLDKGRNCKIGYFKVASFPSIIPLLLWIVFTNNIKLCTLLCVELVPKQYREEFGLLKILVIIPTYKASNGGWTRRPDHTSPLNWLDARSRL